MNLLSKKTVLKIFHLVSSQIIKTIDSRKNLQNVHLVEKSQQYAISFDSIHVEKNIYYWLNFKQLNLDPLFYLKLEQTSLVGNGIVLNKAGQVMLESTIFQKEYFLKLNQNHLVLKSKFQQKQLIDREVISLSNALEDNYFHWIMESISRILLIENRIDLSRLLIVLNQSQLPFKEESLRFLFDVLPENIIHKKSKEAFVCSASVIPSFPHTRNAQTYMTDITSPSIIKLLNKRFIEKLVNSNANQPTHFFLSRKRSDSRRVLNEDYLIKMITSVELKIVEAENLSFPEQARLFFNAKLVISTHGAGLTNIVFCKSATIVELFPEDRNGRDAFAFVQISCALGFHHYLVPYTSSNIHQDVEVNSEIALKINKIASRSLFS